VAAAIPRPVRLRKPDMRRQHREADVLPNVALLVEDGGAEPIEAEPAATLPAYSFRDAALLTLDDLVETWRAMGMGVLAHLDADVAATHLVRDGGCRAGAEEGVEHEVTRVGGDG